jgi:hypothetical protein
VVFGAGGEAGQLNPGTCKLAGLLIVSKLTRTSVLGLPFVSHQSGPIPFSLKCHFLSLRKPAGGRKFGTAGHSAALQELIDRKISI